MNVAVSPSEPSNSATVLRTLLVSDLVDSTQWVSRLGDQLAADLIRQHDRLVRNLLRVHGGQEIDKTDGMLSLFDRPIHAIGFALEYQRALREFSAKLPLKVQARIGIHVGEVRTWINDADDIAHGAKPMEVEGLAKPVAARLMSLAQPEQILLSSVAYTLAHRAEGELGASLARLEWMQHGRFKLKGVDEAIAVFEVGEPGLAPLKTPAWSGKAHRETPLWRRPGMLALEVLILAVLIGFPTWQWLQPKPAIAFAERDWIVLGDVRNLTGDVRFDEGLQEAFRLSMEQSNHVNVLSDLRLAQALELMQRDPDETRVDREVGAELAQRLGARALLLPTIAEVGGKLRLTAEVIDPGTQATVYAESVDGGQASEVLPAVDQLNQRLRDRLGEATASIQNSDLPLAQVATDNLDALRAFTLSQETSRKGDYERKRQLLQHALSLDPHFGRARLELAMAYRDAAMRADMAAELALLDADLDRLTPREKLYLDAVRANLQGGTPEGLKRWRLLAEMYPDFYRGVNSYAYFGWFQGMEWAAARAALEIGASDKNPFRGNAVYLLGVMYLAEQRYTEAISQFQTAIALGSGFQREFYARAFAAQRQWPKAWQVFAEAPPTDDAKTQWEHQHAEALMHIDTGDWQRGLALLDGVREASRSGSLRLARAWASARLATGSLLWEDDTLRQELQQFWREEQAVPANSDDPEHHLDRIRRLHLLAWLAWQHGEAELAAAAESVAAPLMPAALPHELQQRVLLTQAARALHQHDPVQARDLLLPLLDGRELCAVHAGLLAAYRQINDVGAAQREADWLSEHRGRAYAEAQGDFTLMGYNVVRSQLAGLDHIELSQGAEQEGGLAGLTSDWPVKDGLWPSPVQVRIAAMRDSTEN
jgi:putative peptide modification system cyclase